MINIIIIAAIAECLLIDTRRHKMKKVKINLEELCNTEFINDNKKLSLNKLSNATGIRRGTLINYKNNKSKYIKIEHIEKLLDFFVCDIDDLFEVEELIDDK